MQNVRTASVRAFIQARMSSSRFPGKVLAPLAGRPIIAHVIDRLRRVMPVDRIVVATSTEASDDPLASYVAEQGVAVFRGPIDDVVTRLQACAAAYPCEWFFRLCGDSPLLDATVVDRMLPLAADDGVDLVTNVFPRTFPKGQSVELLNVGTFAGLDARALSEDERQHVTAVYYANPTRFRIVNVTSLQPNPVGLSLAVDTVEDLRRLEALELARA